jgi:hypothetical protein
MRSTSVLVRVLTGALLILGPLAVLGVSKAASAVEPKKSAKKKGPSIVLPARKGAAPTPKTKAQPKMTPEHVEIPGDKGGGNGKANNISDELRGPTRIDFDDRLIQGQTNKSGAVYLFDRKETGISSMVKRRKSFKQLTLGTIYDR